MRTVGKRFQGLLRLGLCVIILKIFFGCHRTSTHDSCPLTNELASRMSALISETSLSVLRKGIMMDGLPFHLTTTKTSPHLKALPACMYGLGTSPHRATVYNGCIMKLVTIQLLLEGSRRLSQNVETQAVVQLEEATESQ